MNPRQEEQRFLEAQASRQSRGEARRLFLARQAERRRNLRDPNWRLLRYFPAWSPGMSTAEYVRAFQALNQAAGTRHEVGLSFYYLRTQP